MQQKVPSVKNSPSSSPSSSSSSSSPTSPTSPTIIINSTIKDEHQHLYSTSTPLSNTHAELIQQQQLQQNGGDDDVKNERLSGYGQFQNFSVQPSATVPNQYLNDYNFGFSSTYGQNQATPSYTLSYPQATSATSFKFDQYNGYHQQQQQQQSDQQNYWRSTATSNDYFQAANCGLSDAYTNSTKLFSTNGNYHTTPASMYARFSPTQQTASINATTMGSNDFSEFTNAANLLYSPLNLQAPQRSSCASSQNPTLTSFLNYQNYYNNGSTGTGTLPSFASTVGLTGTTQSPNTSLSLLTSSGLTSSTTPSSHDHELRTSLTDSTNQQTPASTSSSASSSSSSSSSSCSSSVSSLSLSANMNINATNTTLMATTKTPTTTTTTTIANNTIGYDWINRPKNPSNGKTRTKDKYRVVYTEIQRVELEKEFMYSKYITIKRKAELSQTLSLSERQIKIWFQNRRAKDRKQSRKRGGNSNSNNNNDAHDLNSSSNSGNTSINSIDELMNDSTTHNDNNYDIGVTTTAQSITQRLQQDTLKRTSNDQNDYLNQNSYYGTTGTSTSPYNTSTTQMNTYQANANGQFTLTPFSHHHQYHHPHTVAAHHQSNQFIRTFPQLTQNTNSLIAANAFTQFHA